jgi:hypothetical protein
METKLKPQIHHTAQACSYIFKNVYIIFIVTAVCGQSLKSEYHAYMNMREQCFLSEPASPKNYGAAYNQNIFLTAR